MSVSILSIDGGGIKGIISSIVLMRLEKYLKLYSKNEEASLVDYFDILAGTSTGSILTTLLLCPDDKRKAKYSPEDALELYLSKGKSMFRKRPLYPINTFFGLFGNKYTNKYFAEELTRYFGDQNISELLKPCLVVTYDMSTRRTIFLNSISSQKHKNRDVKVVDAILASCAAPTYFPPVCTKKNGNCTDCLIDGGVAANNPAMSALVEALKLPNARTIDDTYLFSVGNVTVQKPYDCKKVMNWGIAQFALPLVNIFMETSEEIVDYQLKKLYESRNIKNQYVRIEAMSEEKIPGMDDTSDEAMQKLVEIGNQLANREELAIRSFAKLLVDKNK